MVEVPPSRVAPDHIYSLAEAYGTQGEQVMDFIRSTGHIVLNALGDFGASKDGGHHPDQLRVAEQATRDARTSAPDSSPAFLFHLGHVVYYSGEAEIPTTSSSTTCTGLILRRFLRSGQP